MISFDQVESKFEENTHIFSASGVKKPSVVSNFMVFSENINFIVVAMSKAKYGSYSPLTKLNKSSNFELTFKD